MCLNLFEALVKTRVSHTREQLAHKGLVHASLNRAWKSLRVSLRVVQIKLTN